MKLNPQYDVDRVNQKMPSVFAAWYVMKKNYDGSYKVFESTIALELTEKAMDKLAKLVGDGKAGVTVGVDKKWWGGYGGMPNITSGVSISVSLACGQTKDNVKEAIDAAHEAAQEASAELLEVNDAVIQDHMDELERKSARKPHR